ncbi:hypothetical protein GPECTOR_310g847 [Gonium pectorale]|uniref:Uncharacterized protein n=1 Tax=Gonium pectorale TaxID=33097 RepID=A0A150FVS4_GONPE|nr:hypothetical protein GPECTOR_310g847 [Gonium pectorale]|eukprot:KXZ41711.1 hypothetical protein GPECTOR_310g847 [Gonium pectorale]
MQGLNLSRRVQLLRLTAQSGVVANLRLALRLTGIAPVREELEPLLAAAASKGTVAAVRGILALAHESGQRLDCNMAMVAAVAAGHREAYEVLSVQEGSSWSLLLVEHALHAGHSDLASWLLERRPATGCSLPVLQSLLQRCEGVRLLPEIYPSICVAAASSRTVDWAGKVAQYQAQLPHSEDSGFDIADRCCAAAVAAAIDATDAEARLRLMQELHMPAGPGTVQDLARRGYLEPLQMLRSRGVVMDALTVARQAASNGRLSVLSWAAEALSEAVVAVIKISEVAVHPGCGLDVLQWLCEHGCPFNRDADPLPIMRRAAQHGDLPMLQWAAATVPPRDLRWYLGQTLCVALQEGQLEVAQWLAGQEGASDKLMPADAWTMAARGGLGEALEWLAGLGCPMPASQRPLWEAANNYDLETLRCLSRLGCPGSGVKRACGRFLGHKMEGSRKLRRHLRFRPLLVIRCLVEEGRCRVNWRRCMEMANILPLDVRTWVQARAAEQGYSGREAKGRDAGHTDAENEEAEHERRRARAAGHGDAGQDDADDVEDAAAEHKWWLHGDEGEEEMEEEEYLPYTITPSNSSRSSPSLSYQSSYSGSTEDTTEPPPRLKRRRRV